MVTQTFEPKLVDLFNKFFRATFQHAKAIRLRQPQPYGSYQDCDILVLSPERKYYLAIECKSTLEREKKIYFSSNFTTDAKGIHQVERMTNFCGITGLMGILAVEIRSGVKGSRHEIRMVPWRVVDTLFTHEEKGISFDEIRRWPELKKSVGRPGADPTKRVLNLDDCLEGMKYNLEEKSPDGITEYILPPPAANRVSGL